MHSDAQNLGEACRVLLSKHLTAMIAREDGTRDGTDSEELHQMRVSLRRLRAATQVFRDALTKPGRKHVNNELSWIDEALGSVRDLDVFLARMAAARKALPPEAGPAIDEVVRVVRRRRDARRAAMFAMLDSCRYREFTVGFRQRIETDNMALFSGSKSERPLTDESLKMLKRFMKRAVKRVEALDETSKDEDLHAARKEARRLRYGAEFFRPLYGKPARKLRKIAKNVQDVLGEHQDACVAQAVLRSIADELRSDSGFDAAIVDQIDPIVEWERVRAERSRNEFFAKRGELRSGCDAFQQAQKV